MLAVENITKTFPGVVALNNVSLEFHAGKVNAIVGENGAGKSTLMKILSGVYPDYEGTIYFKGEPVKFSNIREAQRYGIAIIHQELNLVPGLTIQENIFLGCEIVNAGGLLDVNTMRQKTVGLLDSLRMPLDPATKVGDLKVGQQQVVEIAKALLTDSEVIIMDEPTSAISDKEVEVLFEIIGKLRDEGKAIVYISHKLDELFRLADRYMVMRDGCSIESGDMGTVTADDLIRKMVGRKIDNLRHQSLEAGEGDTLLTVENLSLRLSHRTLDNISFYARRGEVLGVFGLMGAGRTELLETMFGVHPNRMRGSMSLDGEPYSPRSVQDAIKQGVALVPEDRKKDGLVLDLDVRTNIGLTTLERLQRRGILLTSKENELANQYIRDLSIKTSGYRQLVKNLSGGNQQKVVMAKWLARKPKLLLLDEPTRGVDIKAKNEIHKLILKLASEGMGIILVSSELPEILAISTRILVLSEGKLTATLSIEAASEDSILKAAIPTSI